MTAQLLVGLTGGLASGKSTVAGLLSDAGCRVVDADRLVALLYQPDQPGARAVAELFGSEYLDQKGGVDHQRLARLVFADDGARRQLEQAIHPLVAARFVEFASTNLPLEDQTSHHGIVVIEGTLLVEAGYDTTFLDRLVTVEIPYELQLERAIARGMSEAAARARLAAQGDGTARRAAADFTIHNSGTLDDLELATSELLADLARALDERRRSKS